MVFSAGKTDKKFLVTGTNEIKRNHPYFYQMQMQVLLTKRSYCDFSFGQERKKTLANLLYG